MRRRMGLIMLIFPGVLLLVYGYLGWRLADSWKAWVLLALPLLSVLSFILVARRRMAGRGGKLLDLWLSRLAYINMGLVSFLLVASLTRDLAGLFLRTRLPASDAICLAFVLLLVAAFRGYFGPRLHRVRLRYPALPPALRGLRIAQISDLHLSTQIGHRYVARTVRRALAANPDLIMLTGDIGDGNVGELGAEIEALRPLAGAAPVFYVPGNHEVYWHYEQWLAAFRGLGMRVLLNSSDLLQLRGEPVLVAGITDPACEAVGQPPDLNAAANGLEGAAFRVLLSHRPDPADAAAARGFDLQLSGHTHGGQFFPWTLVAAAVHRYSLGLYQIGKMWVYVSAGSGSWGPRLRLGTRTEVALLELV